MTTSHRPDVESYSSSQYYSVPGSYTTATAKAAPEQPTGTVTTMDDPQPSRRYSDIHDNVDGPLKSSPAEPNTAAPDYSPHTDAPTKKERRSDPPNESKPTTNATTIDDNTKPSSPVGAFGGGAATSGPEVEPTDEHVALQTRAAKAEDRLPSGVVSKVNKSEQQDAKSMSKILKKEAKAEKSLLKNAMKELGSLQTVQKQAAAAEGNALSAHSKTAKIEFQKHTAFLAAKADYDRATADLKTKEEALEASRLHARAQTEKLAQKSRELEQLRRQKAADDREREARIVELTRPSKKS